MTPLAITSTSTESKNIPFDTYLTLSKSNEHQLKVHKFRTTENRHGVQKGGMNPTPREFVPGMKWTPTNPVGGVPPAPQPINKAILLIELKKLQKELENDNYFNADEYGYHLKKSEIDEYISNVDTNYQIVLNNFIYLVSNLRAVRFSNRRPTLY